MRGLLVNNELERLWKEASWPNIVLSWYLPGGAEENHEKPQSG
jgi:hypothetical protein